MTEPIKTIILKCACKTEADWMLELSESQAKQILSGSVIMTHSCGGRMTAMEEKSA